MGEWFVMNQGHEHGPYSLDDLRGLVRAGAFAADARAWTEGMADWLPVASAVSAPEPPALADVVRQPLSYAEPVRRSHGIFIRYKEKVGRRSFTSIMVVGVWTALLLLVSVFRWIEESGVTLSRLLLYSDGIWLWAIVAVPFGLLAVVTIDDRSPPS